MAAVLQRQVRLHAVHTRRDLDLDLVVGRAGLIYGELACGIADGVCPRRCRRKCQCEGTEDEGNEMTASDAGAIYCYVRPPTLLLLFRSLKPLLIRAS